MKIRTSLCAAHLLFAASVCGVIIINNNNDSYSEEVVHHHINKTTLENTVGDQRWFPRSMEEKKQAQKNNRRVIRSRQHKCESECNNRILPEEHYEKRSGMYFPSCIFPFKWDSKQHHTCILYPKRNRTWCATRISVHTGEPLSSMWCDEDILFGDPSQYLAPLPRGVDRNEEAACLMPFVHKNKAYYECTSVDSPKKWCATMLSVSGEALMSKYCDDKDKKDKSLPRPPKMRFGEYKYMRDCVFPFWHDYKEYNDCTTSGSEIPWCPLSVFTDHDGQNVSMATVYCSYHPEYDPYPADPSPSEIQTKTIDDMVHFDCKFPLVYRGITYLTCTTDHSPIKGKSWCAAEKTVYGVPKKLIWCDRDGTDESKLPPLDRSVICPECRDLFKDGCVTPFIYEKKKHRRCHYGVFAISWCPMDKKGGNISRIMTCNPYFE